MATPYAGSHHGMHLPLLAGTEVLVAFRDGDPDQPVITAAVPNSENPSLTRQSNPYAHQWRTAGGNGMYLDDRNGRQGLFMHSPSASSTIALGSINTDGGKTEGIAIATKGDDRSISVGANVMLTGGVVQRVLLGSKSLIRLGPTTRFDLLGRTECSLSCGLQWNAGRAYEISGARWRQLAESATAVADAEVELGAALREAAALEVAALRRRVQRMILINVAARAAVAATLTGWSVSSASEQENWPDRIFALGLSTLVPVGSSYLCCCIALEAVDSMAAIGRAAHRARLRLGAESSVVFQRNEAGEGWNALELDATSARLSALDQTEGLPSLLSVTDQGVVLRSAKAGVVLEADPACITAGIEGGAGLRADMEQTTLQVADDTSMRLGSDGVFKIQGKSVRFNGARIDLG